MRKLSDTERESIESLYTIEVLKSSKLNKAPGPDGFSNEYSRYFMDKLKHWIFRYLKASITSS